MIVIMSCIWLPHYSPPTVYGIENPDGELVELIEDEFKIQFPKNTTVEKITLDNSKDSIAVLTFSGEFSIDLLLKENVHFTVEESKSHSKALTVYSISGFNAFADIYAEMKIIEQDTALKRVMIQKRGIESQKLEQAFMEK